MATRIMVVDDHPLFREGLRGLLELGGAFEVVAEAGTSEEALEKVRSCNPDVVLMDISLPDADGIATLRKIRASQPDVSVVMLSMYTDDRFVIEAVSSGAAGYLVKSATYEELQRALQEVQAGGAVLSPAVAKAVFAKVSAMEDAGAGTEPLTLREEAVLTCLCEGTSNKAIARKMYLSESTVKTHLQTIYRKLGVSNRIQAVTKAMGMRGRAR
jgi:DNA-binding NarL/FixJ family response regulator